MTTTAQRAPRRALTLILAGSLWDLVMTTFLFSVVDLPDGLWFLLDAVGMALIAAGFTAYSPRTLPVGTAYAIFAGVHLIVSTDPDGLGFLLGPIDFLIALCGIASTIWITRTEGWGPVPAAVLMFTTSILTIGVLLFIDGEASLVVGLPLYSMFMLVAWVVLRRGSVRGADVADSSSPVTAAARQ